MSRKLWITMIVALIGLPLGQAADPAGVIVLEANGEGFLQIQIQANQIDAVRQPKAEEKPKADAKGDADDNAAKPVPRPRQVQVQQLNVNVDAANPDLQAAARERQRQEQAKQFEGLLQPMLRSELELARKTCGSLVPEARREVLAAGRATVKEIAAMLATRQMNGQMGRLDARQQLRDAVRNAMKPHATAAELAAYDREDSLRTQRRAGVARVQIITKLDDELDLTDAQRQAIEENLVRAWDTAWIRELDDTANMINNRRIAPDYAEAAIVPHLDPGQRDEWKAWCQVAGSRFTAHWQNWQWYSQGLTQADPWWGQWTP